MELYIIRHAQSTNNALGSPQGRVSDPPLTSLGLHQAGLLADYVAGRAAPAAEDGSWCGLGIDRLISSPMVRALQTSQFLSDALDIPTEVWVDIHEWGGIYLDHGESGGVVGYPGKTRSEILREFPGCILPNSVTNEGWWNGAREERTACDRRALEVAARLRSLSGSDQRVALVSHGDFVNFVLRVLFGQLSSDGFYYRHSNTGITRIDFEAGGRLSVYYMNRTDHLVPELVF